MKRFFVLTMILMLLMTGSAFSISAIGSSFGTFTSANTMTMGKGAFAVGAGIADFTSIFGTFTYGLSTFTDGRLKLAFVDPNTKGSDLELALGADFKYQFMTMDNITKSSFDMAFSGFFEYLDFGPHTAIQIGGKLIGSYPVTLQGGGKLTPYGSFNARLESIDFDSPQGNGDTSDSNIEFGFNGGVAWQLSKTVMFYGELQLDGNDGIFLGAAFNTM